MFKRIGWAAKSSPLLVEVLIDLTEIRSVPPGTEEKIVPIVLCPAGMQLTALENVARPAIEARLAADSLTDWQREVLAGILDTWSLQSESLRAHQEYLRTKAAEYGLASAGEGEPRTGRLKGKAAKHPEAANPNRKLVWAMLVAAGVLALVWLGVRWRGGSHRTVGTAAESYD